MYRRSRKKLSFIIPTIDDPEIIKTVRSIILLPEWKSSECEIVIVVNNCPKFFYVDLNEEFSKLIKNRDVNIIYLEKATISSARNAGIRCSSGAYVVHLDNDCILDNSYLINLKKSIQDRHFKIAKGVVKFIPRTYFLSKANCELKNLAYSTRKKVCYTPNLIVSKKVYEKVGEFNEEIFHGEDLEWSIRSERCGFLPVLLDVLVIYHSDPLYLRKMIKNYLHYGVARVYRFKRLLKDSNGIYNSLSFYRRLFGEIPNLNSISSLYIKLSIMLLYLIRDIGVLYGIIKWKKITSLNGSYKRV